MIRLASIFLILGSAITSYAQGPPVTALAFTPDGKSVLAASQIGVQQFSWPELELQRTLPVEMANLHCMAFAPSGQFLAVGGGDPSEAGSVVIFTWPDGQKVATLHGHDDSVRDVRWIGNTSVVSASIDRTIARWQLAQPEKPETILQGHSRSVDALCVLQDGKTLVSAGADLSLRVWDLESNRLVRSLNQHTKPVHALALRPAAEGLPMVASASADRSIRFWQPTIGRMVRYVRLDVEPLDVAWLPDGQRIAATCVDGHVRIVDATRVALLHDLPAIDEWAYCVAIAPGGRSLVVGGTSGCVRRITIPSSDDNEK